MPGNEPPSRRAYARRRSRAARASRRRIQLRRAGLVVTLGAIALLVFLVPVTLFMHKFWGISDAQQAHMQMINFMKNVALMGGALFFVYAGAGAYSLDARSHRTELITP